MSCVLPDEGVEQAKELEQLHDALVVFVGGIVQGLEHGHDSWGKVPCFCSFGFELRVMGPFVLERYNHAQGQVVQWAWQAFVFVPRLQHTPHELEPADPSGTAWLDMSIVLDKAPNDIAQDVMGHPQVHDV
jgi:hypothetical protein